MKMNLLKIEKIIIGIKEEIKANIIKLIILVGIMKIKINIDKKINKILIIGNKNEIKIIINLGKIKTKMNLKVIGKKKNHKILGRIKILTIKINNHKILGKIKNLINLIKIQMTQKYLIINGKKNNLVKIGIKNNLIIINKIIVYLHNRIKQKIHGIKIEINKCLLVIIAQYVMIIKI